MKFETYQKARKLAHGGTYPKGKWGKTEKLAYQLEECLAGLDGLEFDDEESERTEK